MPDLLVIGNKGRGLVGTQAGREGRNEKGLAIGPGEGAETEVQQSYGVAVAGGQVDVALLGAALVQGVIDQREAAAKTPAGPWKGALAMVREHQPFRHAPAAGDRQVRHRLAQLGFLAGVLDEVELVDDVHEVMQLDHAPEHAVNAQPKLPGVLAPVSVHQQIGLAQVCVGAPGIGAVVAIKRSEGEAGALRDVPVERRLDDHAPAAVALPRKGRRFRIPAGLQAQVAGKINRLRSGAPWNHEREGRDCAAKSHQRTRRSAVWLNSL